MELGFFYAFLSSVFDPFARNDLNRLYSVFFHRLIFSHDYSNDCDCIETFDQDGIPLFDMYLHFRKFGSFKYTFLIKVSIQYLVDDNT